MTYRDNPLIARKYKNKRWKELRKAKILLNPFCERCLKNKIYNSAYIIHHKEYITNINYEDDNVFYNIDNLESLCKTCHNEEHFLQEEECYFDVEGNIVQRHPHISQNKIAMRERRVRVQKTHNIYSRPPRKERK